MLLESGQWTALRRAAPQPRGRSFDSAAFDLRHRGRHESVGAGRRSDRRRPAGRFRAGTGGPGAPDARAGLCLHRSRPERPCARFGQQPDSARGVRGHASSRDGRRPHPYPGSGRRREARVAYRRAGRDRHRPPVRNRRARPVAGGGPRRAAGFPPPVAPDADRSVHRGASGRGHRRRRGSPRHLRLGAFRTHRDGRRPRVPRTLPPAGVGACGGTRTRLPRLARSGLRYFLDDSHFRVPGWFPAAASR